MIAEAEVEDDSVDGANPPGGEADGGDEAPQRPQQLTRAERDAKWGAAREKWYVGLLGTVVEVVVEVVSRLAHPRRICVREGGGARYPLASAHTHTRTQTHVNAPPSRADMFNAVVEEAGVKDALQSRKVLVGFLVVSLAGVASGHLRIVVGM